MTATLAACASSGPFDRAAHDLGVATTDLKLPALPAECYENTPLLPKSQVVGQDPHIVVRTYEKQVVPAANGKRRRCAGYYDALRMGLSAPKASKK